MACYLITGGTGSFGKTVTNHLLKQNDCSEIRIFSRDEAKQDLMRTDYMNDSRVKFYIGDVREYNSINSALLGVDYVFHAAALKQVPSCEFFPIQAVQTNIVGSDNVIRYTAVLHAVLPCTHKEIQINRVTLKSLPASEVVWYT